MPKPVRHDGAAQRLGPTIQNDVISTRQLYLIQSMPKCGYVYIMSNRLRTTLYIGVTNDIERRVLEHKAGIGAAFTSRYNLFDLLYVEQLPGITSAIVREKQLKNWHRDWKFNLIRTDNPTLADLAADWFTAEDIRDVRGEKES